VEEAAARLKSEGYPVELIILRKVPHEKALQLFKSADICVGKLMMGYYANFQIETMAMGKPTLCYIRDDLKPFASDCPIVNTTPKNVYENLKRLCEDGELRESLGRRGIEFVKKEHDNLRIGKRLLEYYGIFE
jgi:glycosyltransferase involved in cell wall biosynthesis